jgi:hypothetical protein
MTPAERVRELAADPLIRDTETRASLEFQRCGHENPSEWWALAKHAYLVYPSNPSEAELLRASENPAETLEATVGEMAATTYATSLIVANANIAMSSIQGPELDAFIQECIRVYAEKACRLLRPASDDGESRARVAHLIDLNTTTALASIRMVSHAQAALKDGLSWDEVKQMLPGKPAAETDASADLADAEDPSRSSKLVAYLNELMEGGPYAPSRPDTSCLGEASLLRIEAAVLEIVAKARDTILTHFATMLPTEEHTTTYEQALNSDDSTAAKWLTDLMFREYLGHPIFMLVADECLATVARTTMPLCLESAAQFALAHMPPDEDFVPQLRLKEFKLYLAKALRRDAERVGSKVSGEGPTKSDGMHSKASPTDTANEPGSAGTQATGAADETSRFRERATGSMDRVSLTDPIWDFSGTQDGPIFIKRLSGVVERIDLPNEDEPDVTDLKPEEELRVTEVTMSGRSELRSEIEDAFSGPAWPPVHAIITAFRRYAVKVFDVNAAVCRETISGQGQDGKVALRAMVRNLLAELFGREWENSPGERVIRVKWQDGVDGWKGEEIAVIAGNDADPTCLYHQLVGDSIKHRYRFHAPLPPHVSGEPPGLGVSNLEWWQYIGLNERHNQAMALRPYLEDRIAHWQVVYSTPLPKVAAPEQAPHVPVSSDAVRPSENSPAGIAAARQKIVNPILAAKRWTRGKWVTESGVGKNCIYEYLDGKRNPGTENRQAMADALGLKLEDLPE